MHNTRRAFLNLIALCLAALGSVPSGLTRAPDEPTFPLAPLSVETARGRFEFIVEVAETPAAWSQGLQQRRHLASDAGMLFDFHEPRVVSMWMKDTLIPLDMIFIDARGAIINVVENAVPLSTATISSKAPALAVLEVNAGTAAKLGIRAGDRVLHPLFSAASRSTAPK